MEIERYTLATGETAVAGFARFWKPWGILFCVFAVIPNVWPGWGTAGATTFTYLIGGGNPNVIAIIVLLAIGVALTTSPVVYQALEKAEFFKVGLTIVFLAIAVVAGDQRVGVGRSGRQRLQPRDAADERRRGRDPARRPRVRRRGRGEQPRASPTGSATRASGWATTSRRSSRRSPASRRRRPSTGSMVRQDEENIDRFQRLVQAWPTRSSSSPSGPSASASIIVFSVLAYSTVYGKNISDEADFDFIKGEGEVLKDVVGPWFGTFFWLFGSISLVLVALGVVDYVARLVRGRAQDAAPARERALERVEALHRRSCGRWSRSAR